MARETRASAAKANATLSASAQQLASHPAPSQVKTKSPRSRAAPKANESRTRDSLKAPASSRKRQRHPIKQEEDDDEKEELPHNLGQALSTPATHGEDGEPSPLKRPKIMPKEESSKEGATESPMKTPKKTPKKANYGLTPGVSPYPDYLRPTPEECYEVTRLLEKVHGKVSVPKTIPLPSLDVAGCGEVPSVLDALIRTRLSAATTGKNSSSAFAGLVKRFGTITEGTGAGSVDWDAVRCAPNKEVFDAIQCGGLAKVKSRDIQDILQMVYEENQERKAALLDPSDNPAGADKEPEGERQEEIAKASKNIISLDHVHLLSTNEAIDKLTTYPGIGPKTASCVALFCLQRPSFAVDTHVFRLCKWLGWVPKNPKKGEPRVDRNPTYSHCDVRIPDELKYPLHQLMIKHGKTCPRCRAATGSASARWEEGCPIEHLVKRHGARKGGFSAADRKKAAAAADLPEDTEDADAEQGGSDSQGESELSDVQEDE